MPRCVTHGVSYPGINGRPGAECPQCLEEDDKEIAQQHVRKRCPVHGSFSGTLCRACNPSARPNAARNLTPSHSAISHDRSRSRSPLTPSSRGASPGRNPPFPLGFVAAIKIALLNPAQGPPRKHTLKEAAVLIGSIIRTVLDSANTDYDNLAQDVATAIWEDSSDVQKSIQQGWTIRQSFFADLKTLVPGWARENRFEPPKAVYFSKARIFLVKIRPTEALLHWELLAPSLNSSTTKEAPSEIFVAALKRGLRDGRITLTHIAKDEYEADRIISNSNSRSIVTVLNVVSVNDQFQRDLVQGIWNKSEVSEKINIAFQTGKWKRVDVNCIITLGSLAKGWQAQTHSALAVPVSFRRIKVDSIVVRPNPGLDVVTMHWYPMDAVKTSSSSSRPHRR